MVTLRPNAIVRLPSVWGEDADRWNPNRWIGMDNSKQTTVGVYANL